MKNILFFVLLFFTNKCLDAQIYADISVSEALALIEENTDNNAFTILDVRTEGEYSSGHIENAFNYDFYADDFATQMDSLNKTERIYLIYCASGGRSASTLSLMESLDFQTVYNMLGGMSAWNNANYPATTDVPEFVDLTAPLATEVPEETSTHTNDITAKDITVFPNPSSNYIEISTNQAVHNVHIFDTKGNTIQILTVQDKQTIDTQNLPKGIYLLQFFDGRHQLIKTTKLIKQ